MIINIRVPDEAVKQIGVVMRDYFLCRPIGACESGACERCENVLGCECLAALRDACYNNSDSSNYVCEVTLNEE